MNDIKKRLKVIEEKHAERNRIHVMIVNKIKNCVYEWRGNKYNIETLEETAKRQKTKTIIINDIPRRINRNE